VSASAVTAIALAGPRSAARSVTGIAAGRGRWMAPTRGGGQLQVAPLSLKPVGAAALPVWLA
jgi:hypothetical protein